MGDDTPADRRDERSRHDGDPEGERPPGESGDEERPLGEFGDEERPQAEPAAGEAPLEHLVTGRFGDTTPDPRDAEGEPVDADERQEGRETRS